MDLVQKLKKIIRGLEFKVEALEARLEEGKKNMAQNFIRESWTVKRHLYDSLRLKHINTVLGALRDVVLSIEGDFHQEAVLKAAFLADKIRLDYYSNLIGLAQRPPRMDGSVVISLAEAVTHEEKCDSLESSGWYTGLMRDLQEVVEEEVCKKSGSKIKSVEDQVADLIKGGSVSQVTNHLGKPYTEAVIREVEESFKDAFYVERRRK